MIIILESIGLFAAALFHNTTIAIIVLAFSVFLLHAKDVYLEDRIKNLLEGERTYGEGKY